MSFRNLIVISDWLFTKQKLDEIIVLFGENTKAKREILDFTV